VSREDNLVYVYAGSRLEAEQARAVVAAVVRDDDDLDVREIRLEHWLGEEERWDDEAPQPDVEDEVLARGYAPWEVRVECESTAEAGQLADELEREGYGVVRQFRFVIAGTENREDARRLARRVHGEVEPGGELVWEVTPQNPFAVFGGLGT
jgi:hypothetical protein